MKNKYFYYHELVIKLSEFIEVYNRLGYTNKSCITIMEDILRNHINKIRETL